MLKKNITSRILVIIVATLIVAIIYVRYPLPHEKIDGLISNLFKVSSILIALFMAYIFSKIFKVRSEREERKKEIDKIAYKITEFRRFLYYLMRCRGFWGDYSDIEKLKRFYPDFTYNQIKSDNHNNDRITKYWLEEERFSKTRADIYLASEELVGKSKNIDWVLNENTKPEYSQEQLEYFYYPTSVYWYYFSHRWHKYTKGLFDFQELARDHHIDDMKAHLSNIDEKFSEREIDKNLLADVGTEIYEKQWEKIHELTRINNGKLPKSVRSLISIVVLIGVFGVLIPLLGAFGDFEFIVDSAISFISVTALVGCLIWILLDISSIIKDEIKI